jgi:hypothetical protein
MVSTTSGTTAFYLDVADIVEQALEPLGGEHTSGVDAAKARRVLNLILLQLQNKNIPLNKLDFVNQALSDGTATYTLAASISDVLECNIEKDDLSLPIQRRSLREYQQFPDKTQEESRPSLFITERGNSTVDVTFWPIPDNDDCVAKLLVIKKIEDVSAAYQRVDLPARYLPLLIKWLTYELALTKPNIPADKLAILKAEYLDAMPDTFEEDRERTDWTLIPGGISGR